MGTSFKLYNLKKVELKLKEKKLLWKNQSCLKIVYNDLNDLNEINIIN